MYDNFEQKRNGPSLKISDLFKLMFSNPACVTHVREGDAGYEDLFDAYGDHTVFSLVEYEGDVYVIASCYTYADVVDVRRCHRRTVGDVYLAQYNVSNSAYIADLTASSSV